MEIKLNVDEVSLILANYLEENHYKLTCPAKKNVIFNEDDLSFNILVKPPEIVGKK